MTAGWTGSHMAAGDAAWRAWNRLGVTAWDHMLIEAPGPAILDELGEAMTPELDRVTRLVLDELEVRLYGEARERIVRRVQADMTQHAIRAVNGAIAAELTRPDPVPFTPPLAGSWVRERWRSQARPEPTWRGKWHVFSGDLQPHRFLVNAVNGRTACGLQVILRGDYQDVAVSETTPGVDACKRCAKKNTG